MFGGRWVPLGQSPPHSAPPTIYTLTHCQNLLLMSNTPRMLYLWMLAGLLQGCTSSGLYPASSVSSVESHEPFARLALQPHGVTHVIPFYEVPTVAQVAVLKYSTQPKYVHRLVDVASAQVAVSKLQVRRPAIEKEFYDIEERTIVRPVGTAVLELEEPVSKQLVTPFSGASTEHHSLTKFHRPLIYPVGSYPLVSYRPLQVHIQHYPPASIQQTQQSPQQNPISSHPSQQFPYVSQSPQQHPVASQPPQEFPSIPQSPQQYPVSSQPLKQFPSISHSHQQYPTSLQPLQLFPIISQPPQQYPITSQPPQQVSIIPQFPQQPATSELQPPQKFQFVSQPSPDDSSNSEFDSSDSVVIENPDFTKSSKLNDETKKDITNEDSFEEEFERGLSKDREQDKVVQNIINDFENLQLLRMFSSQTGNDKPLQRSQQRPNFNVLLEPSKTLDQSQVTQKKFTEEPHSIQRSDATGLLDSRELTHTENKVEIGSELNSHISSSSTERESFNSYGSYLNLQDTDPIAAAKPHSTGKVISSVINVNPEESQDNQRKLLELLTGGGEVALTRSGKSVVRGRVLSVTATPCAEVEERVNTRRVVLSWPAHTVEEVDVEQPFTQVEEVAVHEPVHAHIATPSPLFYQ